MRSLNLKLILAFLAVGVVGIAVVAVLAGQRTAQEFSDYLIAGGRESLVVQLSEFYHTQGDWNGVEEVLSPAPAWGSAVARGRGREDAPGAAPGGFWPGGHLSLTDPAGRVIVAGAVYAVGAVVPDAQLSQGTPIEVDDEVVGVLITRRAAFALKPIERGFLDRVNMALLAATAGATVVALLLGVLLARSLTRPLRELTDATRAVAEGNLELQVPVRSRDELGALAESFNRMSAQLGRSRDLRQQMTADIAHDLRTPLSIILGHTEALSEGVLPPTSEALGIVHDEAKRLDRLVEDLRTLSLSEAGELALARRPVSPQLLLQRVAAAHAPQAELRQTSLHTEVDPDVPDVDVDPDRMAQVLDNLVDNALQYTPANGHVSLIAARGPDGVQITVQDTGPGIPAKDLPHVFDRFYRGDKSRHRQKGGSGLGLAIARSLVEAHGGRIWAESTPGEGATFVIQLPRELAK